jgi:hypothetical protein
VRVDCSFDRPERSGSARRPIVEHERKPGSWSAYAHVKTSPIRQTNMIEYVHATILAFHPRTPVSFAKLAQVPVGAWSSRVTRSRSRMFTSGSLNHAPRRVANLRASTSCDWGSASGTAVCPAATLLVHDRSRCPCQ